MTQILSREHRRILESTAAQARAQAESGAEKALKALAVGAKDAAVHATEEQKKLRVRLRAHGRALGDQLRPDDTQSMDHLITEIAYEHWHRMLFARFLAESNLLMHPDGYPVELKDCKEDADKFDPPARSEWDVAGHYASAMLPNVFRPDSPALALQLPLETEQALETLITKLPATVFLADDSLGWSYQFWQAPKKAEVRKQMKQAGTKVGADELPAVTQLFTEPYMVAFLLENSLGAWWQSRHAGKPLPVGMPYLRKLEDGSPAAGTFPAWPDSLADFKLLDPCLGSGHFLVAALHYLVPLRQISEGLSANAAVDRVLAENLHGLELDARCVEIAAFALALAAWRYPDERGEAIGYRPLSRLNIACVGIAPRSKKADWLKLADGDERLEDGMDALYALFQKAPELGSLIDPMDATRGNLHDAHWQELELRLDQALAQKGGDHDIEARVAAQGMMQASRILTRKFHLVITNPPYLGAGQHGSVLKDFCEDHYKAAKGDLANVFLDRSLKLCQPNCSVSLVLPQNWLSLKTYQVHRTSLLRENTWNLLVRIGEHGFESADAAGAFTALVCLTTGKPSTSHKLSTLDLSQIDSPRKKALELHSQNVRQIDQTTFLSNPQHIVSLDLSQTPNCLKNYAIMAEGLSRGDVGRYDRYFWETTFPNKDWQYLLNAPIDPAPPYGGRESVFLWENGCGSLSNNPSARIQGQATWGKLGVFVARSRKLKVTLTSGHIHAQSGVAIVPKDASHLAAIWSFCSSSEFNSAVRKLTPKILIPTGMLANVPFDLHYWTKKASSIYPNGIPEPYSNDPSQWLFHGHPKDSTVPLQVAVSRLLGYKWPAEEDSRLVLSDKSRDWIDRCKKLADHVDDDGIVCLPAVRGEPPAVDRLRGLLASAYGKEWSPSLEARLLAVSGFEGVTLGQWLRDKFFDQHISLFKRRPYIWHIWDGHKEGFSALVNYHLFTRQKLTTLIHLYLGDWITQQKRDVDAGTPDASIKLAKAEALKLKLEAIHLGESPFDVFARWKPIEEQSIGWNPHTNDGVRINIRPFAVADILRIGKSKLGIDWRADNGTESADSPWFGLGPIYGKNEGARINEHHLYLDEKNKTGARNKKKGRGKS